MLILNVFTKKSIIFSAFLLFFQLTYAQKVVVQESETTIETVAKKGLQTLLLLEEEDVAKAWQKKLKEFGKVDANEHLYKMETALIPSISDKPVRILSQLTQTDKGTMIFFAIDLGTNMLTSENKDQYAQAEKILHDFGVMLYREDINEKIKEAEKVLTKTVEVQEKKLKEAEDLKRKIEKNKLQKIQLEQKLVDNANELVQLNQRTEQNKLDQEAAAKDVEKVKRQMEAVKTKLTQVE